VIAAVAAARELPQLSLLDALELTMLIARKDPRRHPRAAARWLQRYLEEHPEATIEEAALAASSLAALPGAGYLEAAQTLKAMAERATRRRRESGVALSSGRVAQRKRKAFGSLPGLEAADASCRAGRLPAAGLGLVGAGEWARLDGLALAEVA
jgi:hypothetical protein